MYDVFIVHCKVYIKHSRKLTVFAIALYTYTYTVIGIISMIARGGQWSVVVKVIVGIT